MSVRGESHYKWKGESVGYRQMHSWVRAEMLKKSPAICSKCGGTKRVEIANITGVYTRDLSNYAFLCKKCHNTLDGQILHLKQGIDAIMASPKRNPTMTHKPCTKCKIVKPFSDFYTDRDSIRSECKECTKSAHKTSWALTH